MTYSLAYVSRSTLIIPEEEARVEDIVAVSQSRNRTLGVTGALLFSEEHFVQVLEGSEQAVKLLMESIVRDERHVQVEVIHAAEQPSRRFGNWSMAYWGSPTLVAGILDPVASMVADAREAGDVRQLIQFMEHLDGLRRRQV